MSDTFDCSEVVCAGGLLFSIELVNNQGANLISNGTYPFEDIKITKNDTIVELFKLSSYESINFLIEAKSGESVFNIILNAAEIDTLAVTLSQTTINSECCGPYFRMNSAKYNGVQQQIFENEYSFEKITVVKP